MAKKPMEVVSSVYGASSQRLAWQFVSFDETGRVKSYFDEPYVLPWGVSKGIKVLKDTIKMTNRWASFQPLVEIRFKGTLMLTKKLGIIYFPIFYGDSRWETCFSDISLQEAIDSAPSLK